MIFATEGQPIPGFCDSVRDAFSQKGILATLGDGDRTNVRYTTMDDPNGRQLRSIRMDRRWFPARRCTRNDASGLWDCVELPQGPSSKPPAGGSTTFAKPADPRAAKLAPSLVSVTAAPSPAAPDRK